MDLDLYLSEYDRGNLTIGAIASHSALDVFDGAVEEGFPTLAICQRGRERTYTEFFRARREGGEVVRGMVDDAIVLGRFRDVMTEEMQRALRARNTIFIPNRSFSSYVPVEDIEERFMVPLFGSRNMLRVEERGEKRDYYWLLERAGLPFPERVEPEEIDELTIIKLHHAEKKLERGFFTATSCEEYRRKADLLLRQGVITEEALANARIERYIIGPVFNFDFFHSPIEDRDSRIELLGIDWRFESSLDGHVRLPAPQQMSLPEGQMVPEYTVVGHNSATLRESLLEKVFPLAERFVEATKEHYAPGIIGPFCLQTCVDKDMNFYIYDVAPRIGGGTNVHMSVGHPYGNALWRRPMSTGRRIAMEIRRAAEQDRLGEICT
ncbi:MAG TPA: formate--phosphoribosylaminoimidazolecarboxamide ligase family protein [Thermoplasmata archaeon]|nr:formate--phosphoribosylaminoimidazolecarboxamide ligase family protein [Thermoplasmata archaeon]